MACLLFGLVVYVFLPATRNGFINYDDPLYVTENSRVQGGPTWPNLKWALTSSHAANWHPLTWMSHMLDCRFYGLKPFGHHLTSILLHALNTLLLFLLLQWMTAATGRSLMVAALFGLHPLRVESVAWVAERKDLLSGLFFMLTLVAYSLYVRQTKVRASRAGLFYVLTMVAFALGLMSKPMLVTVPFVLLLLDWWPLNRFSDSGIPNSDSAKSPLQSFSRPTFVTLACEKAPLFLMSAAACVATFKAQKGAGTVFEVLPFAARAEHALVSYCRYIGKLFWPADLAVYYPHVKGWPLAVVLACGVTLAVVSMLVVLLSRWRPYLFFAWFLYLGMLVPVIGLVQAGSQSMADRYTYLPTIGLLVMLVWGVHDLMGRKRNWEIALAAAGAAGALACAALTHRQIGWWKDSETLFRHAITITGKNTVALNNLGRALGEKGAFNEAMEHYRDALKLNPNDAFAWNGMGVLLMKKGDFDRAAEHLQKALQHDSKNAVTHYNLGIILASRGLLDEAINAFGEAIRLNPDFAEAHNNLGGAFSMQERFDDAVPCYREAIRLKPDNARARKNLGAALLEQGKVDEAIAEFQEAVRLQPDFAEAKARLQTAMEMKANASRPMKTE